MKEEDSERNRKTIKIIILLFLILAVATVWLIKNSGKSDIEPGNAENPDFALEVTEAFDLDKLKSYGLPIIIEFGSDSCSPCLEMAPIIEALNDELQGKAIIKFIDVWKYPEFGEGFPLSVIPTQLFIDAGGKPYKPEKVKLQGMKIFKNNSGEHIFTTHEGLITKNELLDILEEMGMQ